jgi:hypothetical protein
MGIIPGSVANPGVPSTRQLLIGKTTQNLFLYQGALGTLTENAIPCPVGTIDPNSAVYIPTQQGIGAVMFLGSDGQFWLTNGSDAFIASKNIQTLVYTLTTTALIKNPYKKFNGAYNDQFQYYICDFGNNQQLVYKWDTGAWWFFQGWPSGPYLTAINELGLPSLFVASAQPGITGLYEVGLQQTNDNGSNISAYYTTPYLHGGKPERQKIYYWFDLFTYNIGVQYTVTGYTMPRSDNLTQVSNPVVLNDPARGAVIGTGPLIWNVGRWNVNVWGGGYVSPAQPYATVAMHGRLNVPSFGTQWVPRGTPGPLKSGACQFKIAWSAGVPDFRMVALGVGFTYRSEGFVGALPGETAGNVIPGGPNKFTNVGNG